MTDNYTYYNYPLFGDVWSTADAFITDYKASHLTCISDTSVTTLYYLLVARYFNSPINMDSVGQWKQAVMATIYCYGPAWEKRLEVQNKLRTLTESELIAGTTYMHNNAGNPSTMVAAATTSEPTGTLSDKELNFIKDQQTSLTQRGKLEGYQYLLSLLKTDVTTEFLDRFNKLFLNCVSPQRVAYFIYPTEEE